MGFGFSQLPAYVRKVKPDIIMIYNEKIQSLLEALDGKLRMIQNVANGMQVLSPSEVNTTIEDARKIVERVSELVSINR